MPAPELVLQVGHGGEIYALAFAPDGRTLAAAGSERTVKLWDASTGELRALLPHGQRCCAVAFSPDGAILACAGEGEVVLWQPQTGERIATLPGHCGNVAALGFSPDGKLLACASEGRWFGHEVMWVKGGEVQLWDVQAVRLKLALGKSRTEKLALSWAPDGKLLAVASSDNVVRLWDPEGGESRRQVLRHKELRAVAFSADGQTLATAGAGGAKLWDLHSLKLRKSLPAADASSVAFAPAGDKVAVGTHPSVLLYNAASGKREAVLEKTSSNSGVSNLAFSPDGKTLARGSNVFLKPGNISLWDVGKRKRTRLIAGREASAIAAVAFSPEGRSLFSAGGILYEAGDVTQWDTERGTLKRTLAQHQEEISYLALSTNGSLLVAQVGAEVLSWDARTGKKLPRALPGTDAFALSADGKVLAAVDEEAGIRLLDTSTSQSQRTIKQQANVVAFSPDGRTLAAGSERGLSLWDIPSGTRLWKTEKLRIDVHQLAFSGDGRFVASHTIQWKGTKGRDEVRVWDVASSQQVHVISVDDWPFSVIFSPDSALLAVAAGFETGREKAAIGSAVQLWDTRNWRLKHRFLCESEEVKNVTFSPDGRLLAATHANRTASLWDPKRGTRLHVLEDATGELTCLAFSPDGKKLATGNHDGWISFWEVSKGTQLAILRLLPSEKPRDKKKEWIVITPAGYYNASAGATKFVRWREKDRLLPAKAFAGKFRRPDLVAKALQVR
jgi:WD40 repeat protein